MRRFFCFLAVLAAVVLPASADLVTNGTFQPGPQQQPLFETIPNALGTTIPGWTVTTGSVDWIGNYWLPPPSGGYSLDLDGNAPGAVSQTINTTAGDTYWLSFYLAGNPDGPPDPKTVMVCAANSCQDFSHARPPNPSSLADNQIDMGWTLEGLSFKATYASTTISFTSDESGGTFWGPVIGGVSVPEAGFYSTFALGLSGLLMFVRRKRQA